MTDYEFGDFVLVPFPFTDQTTSKKRPAVVVSSFRYHQERADVILMAITSQLHASTTVGEVPVDKWKQAGLLKQSVFKPILATVEKSLVLERLGQLEKQDVRALHNVLESILGS